MFVPPPRSAPVARRGAAYVSVVWLIAVIVMLLVAGVLLFQAQTELAERDEKLATAAAERAALQQERDDKAEYASDLSQRVGWYDRSAAAGNAAANIEAIEAAFNDFKVAFPDIQGASDLESALPLAAQSYGASRKRIQELQAEAAGLRGDLDAARTAQTTIASEKDKQIDDLTKRLADEGANASSRQAELQQRLDRSLAQASELDNEKRAVLRETEERIREAGRTLQRLEARIDQLTRITAFAEAPAADLPDARVLEVSDALGKAWIDVGAKQRLARGMRFRVESASDAKKKVKAWGEVVRVEADSAEIRVSGVVDPFDPVVPGDVLINPLYDPQGGRNAVLVGRFSGEYNANDVKALLERIGIHVQDKVDLTTSYLVVGSEEWTDELGEPLETPIQPSEMAAYKEAEVLGVQIVPLTDLREYFVL